MKTWMTIVLLGLASGCTAAGAQQDAAAAVAVQEVARTPKKPVAQGSVAGHVTLADVKAPARGARIMMLSMAAMESKAGATEGDYRQPPTGTTSLDGSFLVSGVEPGEYAILVVAAGYLNSIENVAIPKGDVRQQMALRAKLMRENAPIVKVSGHEVARIEIELQRGASLSGRVLYSDGAPASQLNVVLDLADSSNVEPERDLDDSGPAMRAMFLDQVWRTDDQGRFRLAGVPAGTYRLAVLQTFPSNQGGGFMEFRLAGMPPERSGALTVYNGNTLHRKDAKLLVLHAGENLDGVEVTLPLSGLHAIHGVAMGKDGATLTAGSLHLEDTADAAISFEASIEPGGEFRFSNIPEGLYQLKVTNGLIFDPPASNAQEYVEPKPSRAFAETSVGVAVQTADIQNLVVTLANTKLPVTPKVQVDDELQHTIVKQP